MDKHYLVSAKFFSGISGETAVWDELHKLNDQYTVFEDLRLPGHMENIDFVVVGPNGSFTVEVKNHSGNITYDGEQLLQNGQRFEEGNFFEKSTI